MKKIFVAFALVGLVAAGCANTSNQASNEQKQEEVVPTPTASVTPTPTPTAAPKVSQSADPGPVHFSDGSEMEVVPTSEVREVDITSSGFSPATITVRAGDYVVFVNKDSAPHWPASNPHPTHTDLPGFDAKKGLKTGERYQFQFTKVGTWGYHDHLNPSVGGKVIVE